MRYPASEKLEIIRLVEQSHLGVGSTLDKLGIPKTTFYRWYDRFLGIVRLTGSDLQNLQLRTSRLQVAAIRPGRRLGLV